MLIMRTISLLIISVAYTCFAVEDLVEEDEYEVLVTQPNERSGRSLFKKLHSGAAFLAGVKLGSYLGNKGSFLPSAGTGSLASSHSFQIFGKTVSTALSLSYGNAPIPVPLHDPIDTDSANATISSDPIRHVIVTVVDNPSQETLNKLKNVAKVQENTESTSESYNNTTSFDVEERKVSNLEQLVMDHNRNVNLINEYNKKRYNGTRINSKF